MKRNHLWCVLMLASQVGCVSVPRRTEVWAPPPDTRAVVVVVDGAGGGTQCYRALKGTVAEQGLPLHVEGFCWTHGTGRFIVDLTDTAHARASGQRLAERIQCLRRQHGNLPVSLVSHSAGAGVVLACAEALPPDSVERIVLLAPAVSNRYDLRPALLCARRGIDCFCSERDWFYLGFGTNLLGTADGTRDTPAGRTGFCQPGAGMADAALYAKLRQHQWDCSVAWTGNGGEHAGTYKPAFLRTQVIPLLYPGFRD